MLLQVQNISKKYGDIWALKDLSLEITEQEFLCILGPSGGGKSTLLHILGGLEQPTSGKVLFRSDDIASLSEEERCRYRKKHVGFIFQFFHLLPGLSVWDNVSLPLLLDGQRNVSSQVEQALDKARIAHRKTHFPNELSGGEMQRVAIARAISNSPELLIADEPTGNLDSKTGREILDLLQELNQDTTLIIATHSSQLSALSSRTLEVRDGQLV